MTRPKLRVRTMTLLVAVVAVVLAIGVHESKRQRVRTLGELVAKYAEREAYWTDQEKAMRREEAKELADRRPWAAANFGAQALDNRDQVLLYGSILRKYQEALRKPGMALDPDPPAPQLYPRDYLPRVPDRRPIEKSTD